MNGETIRISVALVTRNRPDSMARALASLRAQDSQPFEIVVSDDSDPDQAEASRKIAVEFGCRYVPGPRRGLYANRNYAAQMCAGTHIRTMDDDHELPPNHWTACLAAVTSDPCAIWTTGEISYLNEVYYCETDWAGQLSPSGVGDLPQNYDNNWAIADGSTIYPREIFERKLWMVEDYGYGSAYLEYGAYLYQAGFRSRCVPGAKVIHWANSATINRGKDPGYVANRLLASLVYHLYFRPNQLKAIAYVAKLLIEADCRVEVMRQIPKILKLLRLRWKK